MEYDPAGGMVRRLAIALVAGIAAVAAAGTTTAAPTVVYVLHGSVSRGHITLKGGLGTTFLHGRPGLYRIAIADSSSADDFRLVGPGVNVVITSVPFVGAHSVQLTLRAGTYRYYSDPHRAGMRGSFAIG
jgi:hypothetical protein